MEEEYEYPLILIRKSLSDYRSCLYLTNQKNAFYKSIKPFGYDKINNTNFYEMKIGLFDGFAQPIPIRRDTPRALLECSLCEGLERRDVGITRITMDGNIPADIYQNVKVVLAGEKVQDLIRGNRMVGVRFCDLEIEGESKLDDNHISKLKQIEILGRCYKIFTLDGLEIEHCPLCKRVPENERIKADNGIQIIYDYWDGSNIFMFDYGLLSIIVTHRVKEIFERNKVSNVKFEPISEITMR